MKTMENPLSQMFANSIVSEHVPPGRLYFINPKYFPTGELDMDATAADGSVLIAEAK